MRYFLRDPIYRAQSAWSSEDLLSNYIGAFFGAYVLDESDTPKTLAAKLKMFLTRIGVGAPPPDDSSAMAILPQDVGSWIGQWSSDPLIGVAPYSDVHKFFQRRVMLGDSPEAYHSREPDVSWGMQEFGHDFNLYLESKATRNVDRGRIIEEEMSRRLEWARRHYEK